jgi:plasmid stability protein
MYIACTVASLTIKKFPDELLDELKNRAAASRRSVTQEVLVRLDASLREIPSTEAGNDSRHEAERQADAWSSLAGKWKSSISVKDEIAQIYKARTRGRKVAL